MDAVKPGAAFFALFDCRWPIRCHLISLSAVDRDFLQGFLDLVFAEIALSGGPGGADAVGVESLGNGYEEDVRRVPADPARGLVDPGPDGPRGWRQWWHPPSAPALLDVLLEHVEVRLGGLRVGAVGRQLQVRFELLAASGSFPRFRFARPSM